MKLKSGDLIFLKEVFLGSKKIREAIRKKMEKAKAWKEVNVELFIVE